jgi:hypothetical protein
MAYTVDKVAVYVGDIKDKPGGLSEKLAILAEAGAKLEFVIARRQPNKPGKGVVFVSPVVGPKQVAAAKKCGLKKTPKLHSVRIIGPDKKGLGACLTAALAEKGINLRGFSGAAIGRKAVLYFAFDSGADAGKAQRVLKKALGI